MKFKMQCESANQHQKVDGDKEPEDLGTQVVLNGVPGQGGDLSTGNPQVRLSLMVDGGRAHEFQSGGVYEISITRIDGGAKQRAK